MGVPTGRLFTVADASALTRLAPLTLYRKIQSGELPALRFGRRLRIWEDDIARWLRRATGQPAGKRRHRSVKPRRRPVHSRRVP